jgi:flagellar basal-body rod modification protein FlgD
MATVEGLIGNKSGSLQILEKGTIGKDDFLKMMIAQLQNQDPLNPLDGTDFTAQLAQFSSLEQLNNVNTQLEVMGLYQSSLNNAQAVSLVGKEVTASGNSVIAEGASADLGYTLSGDAGKVTIRIYDEEGTLVDTLEPGPEGQKEGQNSVTWDCGGVPGGTYTFEVSAVSASGGVVASDTVITGRVTGVTFVAGAPFLCVNGQDISFGSVLSVNETGT